MHTPSSTPRLRCGRGTPANRLGIATTFASLRMPGFAVFLASQTANSVGLWALRIAVDWLVVDLTGSAAAVGTVAALQFLPLVLLAPFAGVIADRYPSRNVLLGTQSLFCLLPATAAMLIALDAVTLPVMYLFAFLLGVGAVIDGPARQTFINTLVGTANVGNAVSLSSVAFSLAGMVGPLLAGWLIGPVGIAWCFAVTSIAYLPNLVVVFRAAPGGARQAGPVPGGAVAASVVPGGVVASGPDPTRIMRQLLGGLRHVAGRRRLAVPMVLVTVIGALSTTAPVLLVAFTTGVFDGGAGGYAQLTAAMAAGSGTGAVLSARRSIRTLRGLFVLALATGLVFTVAALSPTRPVLLVLLFAAGALSLSFLIAALTMLQTGADLGMRGRVYSIYALAQVGATPVLGPVIGWSAERFGARPALFGFGLAATFGVVLIGWFSRPRRATGSAP